MGEQCPGTKGLKKHMQVHAEENKQFIVHAEEKPFCCAQCTKSLVKTDGNIEHMRVHVEERQLSCEPCVKHCPGTNGLKRHMKKQMRVQTGERQFSCEQCGEHCPGTNGLKKHMRETILLWSVFRVIY